MNEFDLELYEEHEVKFLNLNMIVLMTALTLTIIYLMIADVINENIASYFGIILVVAFSLSYVFNIRSFFSKYESRRSNKGSLKFKLSNINWNNDVIEWHEIKNINIQFNEISGDITLNRTTQNNISDGFNPIQIITFDNREFKGHYQLRSKIQLEALQNFLWKCIVSNKLEYKIAKHIVQPSNYNEHQELKRQLRINTDNTV